MSSHHKAISVNHLFSELPTDMWNEIFNFLTPLDVICVMSNVCNIWRTTVVKHYFQNYLQKEDRSAILKNIKSINELFNDKTLLQKFKRYLFRQYIKQKAQLFSQFAQCEDSNLMSVVYFVDYCKELDLEKEINEINIYCNLFTMPQNTEPLRISNKTVTATTNNSSCFGSNSKNHQQTIVIDEKDKIYIIKVVMLGLYGVGKTSFMTATVSKQFNNPFATIGCEFSIKTHKFGQHLQNNKNNNNSICYCNTTKLQLWDICGPERFKTITSAYYRGAEGFFICFDLNDRKSFGDVYFWKKEIEKNALPKTRSEIVLLGTKADLIDNNDHYLNNNDDNKKIVKREEAEELEFEMELIYVETSSKEMKNVDYPTWYLVLIRYCFNKFKREQ